MLKEASTRVVGNPSLIFNDVFDWVDSLGDLSFIPSLFNNKKNDSYPRLNVSECNNELRLEASVPGLSKDDVNVVYSGGYLTISGSKQNSEESKDQKYHVRELHKSSFSRSFYLPDSLFDTDKFDCSLRNGLLTVVVPRKVKLAPKALVKKLDLKD